VCVYGVSLWQEGLQAYGFGKPLISCFQDIVLYEDIFSFATPIEE